MGRPLGGRGERKCSVQGLAFGAPARRTRRTQMFGARFSVWGARLADEANANVRCKVQRLGRPLGGRGERKCSVQGLAFGRPLGGRGERKCSVQGLAFRAPARRTRRTQMFGARFSVWGGRKCSVQGLAFGAPARRTRRTQMFGARFSVWGARSADEANANVRCKV